MSSDTMQVCRNGHVITDRMRAEPESSRWTCEVCGAMTLHRCPTCGNELAGERDVPGLLTVGSRPAPRSCDVCGAPLPWVRRSRPGSPALVTLESLLRRVPHVVRQLRWRQSDKPPFRVEDERDLEDLLRALLALQCADVRLEGRTPKYSPGNRTDFVLMPQRIAVTVKYARPGLTEAALVEEVREDTDYYCQRGDLHALLVFILDPQGVFRDVQRIENCARSESNIEVRCVLGV